MHTIAVEGDVNATPARERWLAGLDAETRDLLRRDEEVFFRQSLSTPCLNAVAAASGSGAPAGGASRADSGAWLAVAAGTIGSFMALLDVSIVNASLPTIQGEIVGSGDARCTSCPLPARSAARA